MQEFPASLIVLSPRPVLTGAPAGDALENVITFQLADGALCYVKAARSLYQLDKSGAQIVDGVNVIAPIAGPGRWLLKSAKAVVQFSDVRPGLAPNDPIPVVAGATYGFLMDVGDFVYGESPIQPTVDRTQPLIVTLSWAPAASEAGKTVTWDAAVTLAKDGANIALIDFTKSLLNVAVPAVAATYQDADFLIPPVDWATDPAVDELHLRFTRVATASDPTLPPGVHHIAMTQFLL